MLEFLEKKPLEFAEAAKYPFNRADRMLNILWMFLPIVGWLALGGYSIRIVEEFIKGKFKELPEMEFKSDLSLGFHMLIKAIPFIIAYAVFLSILSKLGILGVLVSILVGFIVLPMLYINFIHKQTVASLFEFDVLKAVFENIEDYSIAIGKSVLLGIIFLVMSFVLIGIPAGSFTKNIFLADFYRRKIKSFINLH